MQARHKDIMQTAFETLPRYSYAEYKALEAENKCLKDYYKGIKVPELTSGLEEIRNRIQWALEDCKTDKGVDAAFHLKIALMQFGKEKCQHDWPGSFYGVIIGISKCKKCGKLAVIGDFPNVRIKYLTGGKIKMMCTECEGFEAVAHGLCLPCLDNRFFRLQTGSAETSWYAQGDNQRRREL